MKQILTIFLFLSWCHFASAQTINAGSNQTINANESVQLDAQSSGPKIKWFTNGTGTFDNRLILNAIYTPSAADIATGEVKLLIVNRRHPLVRDLMKLTILPECVPLLVNAGADVVQCGYGFGAVPLNAQIDNNASGMLWSTSGFGFFEDETNPTTTYYYDQTDVDYAFINLTATAFNSVNCPEVSDDLSLNLQAAPYLEFPEPYVYTTSDNPVLYLSVYRYGYASSGTWTSSGTGTFDDANSDYTAYNASQQDILNGSLSFTFTTNDPDGPCGSTSGNVEGYIEYIPNCPSVSFSTYSDTVCGIGGQDFYPLFASFTGTENYLVQWTTDGSGTLTFDPNAPAIAYYDYSEADINPLGVNITCTVYENPETGFCYPNSAVFNLLIDEPATISLSDFSYASCGGEPVNIAAAIGGSATTVYWSGGTGIYDPNPGVNTTYYPSAQDISFGGSNIFGATDDPSGVCNGTFDDSDIIYNPQATVDAGDDIVVCGYSTGAVLVSATIENNGNGMEWTTSGFGYFADPNSPTTAYYYDQTDVDYAFINLTATAFSGGNCPDVSDDLSLNLQAAPRLEFPEPVVYAYSNNPILYVSVYRYGYASSGTWTSSGTGTFDDATSDYAAYTASQEDILNGSVSFTFTTNDPDGPCGSTSGSMQGVIFYSPTCATISIFPVSDTICGSDFGGIYNINANITGLDNYVQWTSSGDGYFNDETSAATYYEYSPSDAGFGGVTLTCTVYDSYGYCSPVSASFYLKLNDPARIDLSDFGYEACGDSPVAIDGNISGVATTVYWSTSGTGTFSENPSPFTAYTPSLQDRLNGTVDIFGITNDPEGDCAAAGDYTYINLYGPVVNAGADIVECGYEFGGSIPVNATLGNNTYGITWTTDGFGYFDDETSASTNYNYNATDVNYAFINLIATASNGGGCLDFSDVLTVNLQAAPSLEFPNPVAYATSDNPILYLSVYRYGYASSGSWTSSGTGTFDNASSDYPAYTASAQDIANQYLFFTYTSNDPDGPCGSVSGTMEGYIEFSCPVAYVYAGGDIVECGYGYGSVYLNATIDNNGNGMLWTTSGFGYFENENSASTYYIYDQSDVDYANITLTATAFNNAGCPESSDDLSLNLQAAPYLEFPEPYVYAYSDNPVLYVNVYRYGYASSGTWTSSGTGTFSDANADYSAYTASVQDINNGGVTFTFTSNDPDGPCGSTSGTMEGYIYYVFTECPTVSFTQQGDTICAADDGGDYDLLANVTGSNISIVWTTTGDGNLFNDYGDPAFAIYNYTAGDIGSTPVILTCTVYDNNGQCAPVSASYTLKLNDQARIDFSTDYDSYVCGNTPVYMIGGISGFATTVYWTSSGGGTFSPNPAANTYYYPTLQERINGSFDYSGTTNDPEGPCSAVSDYSFKYIIGPAVNAGTDQTVCGSNSGGTVLLDASANGNLSWVSSGTGTFDDPNSVYTNYNYSEEDVNYGNVSLFATATSSGCPDDVDVVAVSFQPAPYLIFPEPNMYVCDNSPYFNLSVNRYGNTSGGVWTCTGTGFFDNANSDYTTYYASYEDILNAYVLFTYTTNDPEGDCLAATGSISGYITYCGGGGGDGGIILKPSDTSIESGKSISLYPNPSTDLMRVVASSEIDFARTYMTDLAGKIIACDWQSKSLNVALLQNGIYFLHVKTSSGLEVLKFVKQ